jgi:hypothetical protein
MEPSNKDQYRYKNWRDDGRMVCCEWLISGLPPPLNVPLSRVVRSLPVYDRTRLSYRMKRPGSYELKVLIFENKANHTGSESVGLVEISSFMCVTDGSKVVTTLPSNSFDNSK